MKFFFVGNRQFVLDEMIKLGANIVKTCVIANTHLERDIIKKGLEYTVISSKNQLLEEINNTDFDIFLSNGCPYILPISKLKPSRYVNIHPSYLPDLRGADPTLGSILFQRDTGATCHIMNDKIDAGDIISQVKIPFTEDVDVSLMYQLSFIAEKEAFRLAFKNNFKPVCTQSETSNLIYYSRSSEDNIINFDEPTSKLQRRIRSFSNKSQGCLLKHKDKTYKFHQIELLSNPYLFKYAANFSERQVIFNYEGCIIFKHQGSIILLRSLTDDVSNITPFTTID